MKHTALACLATLATLAAPLRAQEPAIGEVPDALPTFDEAVDLVTVDVVVTDGDGRPVTGLTAADFEIHEDGVPQEIVSFEAVDIPERPEGAPAEPPPSGRTPLSSNVKEDATPGSERTFFVVFDDVHLIPFHAQRAKAAVAAFLETAVPDGDRVTLVSTSGSAWWSARMPEGRDELIALLKRLEGQLQPELSADRISPYEAMRIHMYNDAEIEQRVSRRFQAYGAFGRGQPAGSAIDPRFGRVDPLVRSRAADVYLRTAARSRVTLALLERLLDALALARGRKSLVLVSEGFIYDSNLRGFRDVLQAARRANAAIYFLDARGLEMPAYMTAEFGPPLDARDIGFTYFEKQLAAAGPEDLARDSGGFTVRNTNDLSASLDRLRRESRHYYLLGYNPRNRAADGAFREIRVEARPPGLRLRARRGYFAPGPKGAAPDPDEAVEEARAALQRALDSPYESDAIPLRLAAYVYDETLGGRARVALVAEVDTSGFAFEERDGRFHDTLELVLLAAHRETGEFHRIDEQLDLELLPETRERLERDWFPIVRDFELAPGGQQAKIVVRDAQAGTLGTLVHVFEVPELEGLRVSTPVISDALQAETPGAEGARLPTLVAHRSFPADAPLYCSFDVYGAGTDPSGMPRVVSGYGVRRLNDNTLHALVDPSRIEPTSLGHLSRTLTLALENPGLGDYELVLFVKDMVTGESRELRERFSLVAPRPSPRVRHGDTEIETAAALR